MDDSNSIDTIKALEAKGFKVKLTETGLTGCEQWLCYLTRDNRGKGYFGWTEEKAIAAAVEGAEWSGWWGAADITTTFPTSLVARGGF